MTTYYCIIIPPRILLIDLFNNGESEKIFFFGTGHNKIKTVCPYIKCSRFNMSAKYHKVFFRLSYGTVYGIEFFFAKPNVPIKKYFKKLYNTLKDKPTLNTFTFFSTRSFD